MVSALSSNGSCVPSFKRWDVKPNAVQPPAVVNTGAAKPPASQPATVKDGFDVGRDTRADWKSFSGQAQGTGLQTASTAKTLAPDKATAEAAVQQSYADWKAKYVTADGANGALRVQRPENNGDTVSEGIGYGMLLAANNGDQTTFDGLWKYAQSHLNENGLMNWRIDAQGGTLGQNGATDADEDMAMALVSADKKWGGYKQDATTLIDNILEHEVEPGTNVLKPGDAFGGSSETNPSYFAPAYYKEFSKFTGDTRWDQVADASYDMLDKALKQPGSKDTGLVPDWMDANGKPLERGPNSTYDAMRTPWRIGLDAAWNDDPRASAYLDKVNTFWKSQGVENIGDTYALDGTPLSKNHNATAVSMAAAGAIADPDAGYRGAMWNEMVKTTEGGGYFGDSLRALSLLTSSGQMARPSDTSAPRVDTVSGPQGVSGDYGAAQAMTDMDRLSSLHPVGTEMHGVGDANRAEFEKNKRPIAEAALSAAKRYFPELPLQDATRMLLADIAQESTFNPKLNVEPNGSVTPDKTIGLLQPRAASNLEDFRNYASGNGLNRADGSAWDPKQTQDQELANVWENVHVGAWYMSQMARLGAVSANEHYLWGRDGTAPTTVQTGLLSHFMGPGGAANEGASNPGAARYLSMVGGEMDFLQSGLAQRVYGTVLKPGAV
ncbi:glycosyl hydrolase family 8 [Corallococcus sp. AB038B]|uniref:glycosyl hydrolase family 8 n=1 Tax=Corallococcus sp. AB038B TaxID=2316718 RepID=UPI0013157D26|nr:glycosyl hydrolase family 8 [Corallococcus sp. AB038B]